MNCGSGGTACGKSLGLTDTRRLWPFWITAFSGKTSTSSRIGSPGLDRQRPTRA